MKKSIWLNEIWNLAPPAEVAAIVADLGCDIAIIKTSDGHWPKYVYGETWWLKGRKRNTARYVEALRALGIEVHGFHWADPRYGTAADEAYGISRAITQFGFTNYNLNVESLYYKHNSRLATLLGLLPPQVDYSTSLCKWPSNYVPVNYPALLGFCKTLMPMVYWLETKMGAEKELERSQAEWLGMMNQNGEDKPIVPLFPTYIHINASTGVPWVPTAEQMIDAANIAGLEGITELSFFALNHYYDARMEKVYEWLKGYQPEEPIHWDSLTEEQRWSFVARMAREPNRRFLTDSGHIIE